MAWFKKSYKGENSEGRTETRWHIAAFDYDKNEFYNRYLALCGYEIEVPYLKGATLSKAKNPNGVKCSKCLKKAEEIYG